MNEELNPDVQNAPDVLESPVAVEAEAEMPNYSEMSLAELSQLFEEFAASEDRMKKSKEADAIKAAFYKRLARERSAVMGEDAAEVTTTPEAFTDVCNALEAKGYTFISADVAQVPSTTTTLTDPDQLAQMGKLLDALDDDDDVQNAWHTLENEEDLDR